MQSKFFRSYRQTREILHLNLQKLQRIARSDERSDEDIIAHFQDAVCSRTAFSTEAKSFFSLYLTRMLAKDADVKSIAREAIDEYNRMIENDPLDKEWRDRVMKTHPHEESEASAPSITARA